ncbi:uncharacterized protein [Nicotiana sylvestris]|uniref:uncharacterized protein n=1 Tax=Nicotiana sylvestris TaxID=4096 RepID=UPI00388C4916
MILALVAQPPRGGGQNGRGRPRGGGQTERGHPATAQSGSTYSYVSSLFARFLVIAPEPLGTPVHVSTHVGDSIDVDRIYQSCVVTFYGFETRVDLILLDMIDFKVILGIDWLSLCHTVLNCHAKTVTLVMLGFLGLEWKGSTVDTSSWVISFLKSWHMVEKGCLAYLAYVRDTTAESLTIDSVSVVREFADVFPSDLPGMPLDRDIDFCIDLAPDISEPSRVLACVVAQSSLLGQIKARQFNDPHLAVLRERVLQGSAKEVSIGEDGVLQLQGHLCVPNVDGLRERILEKAHSSRYSIHPDLVKDALEEVKLIQERLRPTQFKQKSYADQKARDVLFMVGEKVLLKVSPMKDIMRSGKKGKLSPRFICPFEVLRRVGEVAYELALPPSLSGVHPVFHVLMLRKYHAVAPLFSRAKSGS